MAAVPTIPPIKGANAEGTIERYRPSRPSARRKGTAVKARRCHLGLRSYAVANSAETQLKPWFRDEKGHDCAKATQRSDHRNGGPKICPIIGQQEDAN